MKLYKNGNNFATYKVNDDWEEFEDEIVETPIGTQLKSYTKKADYKKRVAKQEKINRIAELKRQIAKYKEDVEQVELFGMERADYEEKKQACVDIIEELRELEAELKA